MEEIVKALNNYVIHNYGVKGTFIHSHNSIKDKNFKALTKHSMYLYYTNNGNTYPIIETSVMVNEGFEYDSIIKLKFLEEVYDYVASDEFRQLMDGTINI